MHKLILPSVFVEPLKLVELHDVEAAEKLLDDELKECVSHRITFLRLTPTDVYIERRFVVRRLRVPRLRIRRRTSLRLIPTKILIREAMRVDVKLRM